MITSSQWEVSQLLSDLQQIKIANHLNDLLLFVNQMNVFSLKLVLRKNYLLNPTFLYLGRVTIV